MRLSTPRSWSRLRVLTIQSALPPSREALRRAALLLLGLMAFDDRVAGGQSIAITGRAIDAVSGRAISGAEVTLASRTVVTDAEGQFKFEVSRRTLGDRSHGS